MLKKFNSTIDIISSILLKTEVSDHTGADLCFIDTKSLLCNKDHLYFSISFLAFSRFSSAFLKLLTAFS